MSGRRWGLAAIAAAALGAWLARSGGTTRTATAVEGAPPPAPLAHPVPAGATPAPELAEQPGAVRGGIRDPLWGQDPPEARDPLEAYLASSIYPPQSRPLGRFNDDLLNPNQRYEEFRPVPDTDLTFRFTADRYFVNGDDPLLSTLEVRRGDAAIPVTVTTAFVAPFDPTAVPPPAARVPLAFERQGSVYVNVSSPAALARVEATSILGVYIEFAAGDGEPVRAMFSVHATPASVVPARFTGEFRDYIRDGSLVVEVGVEVRHAGWFLLDCNLYDADDNPVAWTRFKGDLAVGRHMVALEFFGKVLVDSRSTPPFHIGQLRGSRFVEGRDPDLDLIDMYEGSYETARYALDDFSAAVYDSPDKRARIERLEDARDRGVHGF